MVGHDQVIQNTTINNMENKSVSKHVDVHQRPATSVGSTRPQLSSRSISANSPLTEQELESQAQMAHPTAFLVAALTERHNGLNRSLIEQTQQQTGSSQSERPYYDRFPDPDTVIMPSLPTDKSTNVVQNSKRVHFDGFPAVTTPLPADIQDEEIIKHWPNHLWGSLLLRITANFSPKEIGALNGAKLKPNTIAKRIVAAKKQAGIETQIARAPKKQGPKRKRASMRGEGKEKGEGAKNGEGETKGEEKEKDEGTEHAEPSDLDIESAASDAFLASQQEIQEAIIDKDPDFFKHQLGVKKKNTKRHRELLDQVVQEREIKRLKMVGHLSSLRFSMGLTDCTGPGRGKCLSSIPRSLCPYSSKLM